MPGTSLVSTSWKCPTIKLGLWIAYKHKINLFIGCGNVQTLLDVKSQVVTMCIMQDYRVSIVFLSEFRLPGWSSGCIKHPGFTPPVGYIIVDHKITQASTEPSSFIRFQQRVAFMDPVSSRIASARFSGKFFNITVTHYTHQLQAIIDNVLNWDILIMAGAWNTLVGSSNDNNRNIIGKFGLDKRCENGAYLPKFSDINRICVFITWS